MGTVGRLIIQPRPLRLALRRRQLPQVTLSDDWRQNHEHLRLDEAVRGLWLRGWSPGLTSPQVPRRGGGGAVHNLVTAASLLPALPMKLCLGIEWCLCPSEFADIVRVILQRHRHSVMPTARPRRSSGPPAGKLSRSHGREKRSVRTPRVQRPHDWLVRMLAERSFHLLRASASVSAAKSLPSGARQPDDHPMSPSMSDVPPNLARARGPRFSRGHRQDMFRDGAALVGGDRS
jgi:hypothetical protein